MGKDMSYGRFDTYYSSDQVADVISSTYCQSNGDLRKVFAPWVACNGGGCQHTFELIYNKQSDSLMDLTRDSSVGRYGGSDVRTCRFEGTTTTFICYYVNYENAQGHTGSWVYSEDETPPLALPYYVFQQIVGGVSYEWRYWMLNDTGFGFNIAGRRTYGANSRDGLTWFNVELCDITYSRGSCGVVVPHLCHTFTFGSTIPAGFGVPWDFFTTPPNELVLNASCSATAVTAQIHKPFSIQHHYTYIQGYQWNSNFDRWEPFIYQCEGQVLSDAWCTTAASASLNPSHPFFIAFTCSWVNNQWKCGCRDPQCAQGFWQLQQFQP
jgi:hypothetical protein